MTTERDIDRTISFKNSQGVKVRGTLSKITRRGIVFEIYNPYSLVQFSEVLTELELRRGGAVIFRGGGVVSSLVSTGIVVVVSASLFGAWSDLSKLVAQSESLDNEFKQFMGDWERSNTLDPNYQLKVADLRSFLSDLSFWLDQVGIAQDSESGEPTSGVSDTSFAKLNTLIEPKLSRMLLAFENATRSISSESADVHKLLVQRDLHPLLLASPFFNRVFTKPLGYAGDYEMVNMILKRERGGPTTFAQIVNDWFLAGGPPTAHRNRVAILSRILHDVSAHQRDRSGHVRILNIGCGPAQEVQRFVAKDELAHRCSFELMDFNEETLRYAESQIDAAMANRTEKPAVTYVLRSVHDLLKQAVKNDTISAEYDLVYCAGLFDYLSDRVCSKLVPLFYGWTKPGGRVVVTNVHSSNYARGIMEHLMEWYLVLRDEDCMMALMPDVASKSVYTDQTGINVFLDIKK